jgi:putative restriction endonuclease
VTDYWHKIGQDGFRVWQFRLASADSTDSPDVDTWNQAPRVEAAVQRIVRNTAMATNVKDMHNHTCQVCGQQLRTAAGLYAEAAHIRALGAPHHGPDALDNILCLCPNDQVLFDNDGIYVGDDNVVRDAIDGHVIGHLRTTPRHPTATVFAP